MLAAPAIARQCGSRGSPSRRVVIARTLRLAAVARAIPARTLSVSASAQWTSSTVTRTGSRSAQALTSVRDDALLALRPGRRIHRFINAARRVRLRDLEQIAQIKGVVRLQCSSCWALSIAVSTASADSRDPRPRRPATIVRTAPWPRSVPKSRTRPAWVAMPDAAAAERNSSINRVLPIPASPRITMTPPYGPSMQASRTARN